MLHKVEVFISCFSVLCMTRSCIVIKMGFNSKRWISYVKHDRLDKVKGYIKSYGSDIINLPLDHRKRTAIHIACKYRSSYSLNRFLQYDPNFKAIDKNGNTPLHLFLEKSRLSAKEYDDILQPLLLKCSSDIWEVVNNKGITARQLLRMKKRKESSSSEEYLETKNIPNTSYAADDVSDDADWYEKLNSLADEDYEQEMGRFEQDEFTERERKETYDEWTNRMEKEYNKKHHNQPVFKSKNRKDRRKSDDNSNDYAKFQELKREDAIQQKNRDRKRRLLQKMKFISKTNNIFCKDSEEVINLNDLPWLRYINSEETLLNVLLVDVDRSDTVLTKKSLREHILQWHPDKFSQLCSHRLKESEKAEVLAEVNRFSQIINSALQNLN